VAYPWDELKVDNVEDTPFRNTSFQGEGNGTGSEM
jgi:hypothetical protein